jgi:hypothetical protein
MNRFHWLSLFLNEWSRGTSEMAAKHPARAAMATNRGARRLERMTSKQRSGTRVTVR